MIHFEQRLSLGQQLPLKSLCVVTRILITPDSHKQHGTYLLPAPANFSDSALKTVLYASMVVVLRFSLT
jgi:hypothetical protein